MGLHARPYSALLYFFVLMLMLMLEFDPVLNFFCLFKFVYLLVIISIV